MVVVLSPYGASVVAGSVGAVAGAGGAAAFPFLTPFGVFGLPWWILAVILGREAFMSVFRPIAARRGVVISAIGPAKWKTTTQLMWAGSAFCWFFIATVASHRGWASAPWQDFAYFNGTVGVAMMLSATVLTVYSLVLYLRSYGALLAGAPRGRV